MSKVLMLPLPVLVHRPDLPRGLRALHDVRVRSHLLQQVAACPRAMLRKAKVSLAPDDDAVLGALHRETSVPNYHLVAAALLVAVFDQTYRTHGARELQPAPDKGIIWSPSPPLPSPTLFAAESAVPLTLPIESTTTVADLLSSHDDAVLAERLAATHQAWQDAPCDSGEDILHRAALGRGLRLLEQAVAAAASCRRPVASATARERAEAAHEGPALDIL